jgi:DNA invertase Pin-like site-specific DNA recombinase
MPVAEQTDWLDGPRFVVWLEENGLFNVNLQLGSGLERRFRDWRRGAAASVYTADRALVRLGRHLSEIPDDLFTRPPIVSDAAPITEEQINEIVRRAEAGEAVSDIARAVGVCRATVRRHRGKSS